MPLRFNLNIRWPGAIVVSLLLHALLAFLVISIPAGRDEPDPAPPHQPRLTLLTKPGRDSGARGGAEEESVWPEGGSLSSPLLIEPKLVRPETGGKTAGGFEPGPASHPGMSHGAGAKGAKAEATFFSVGTPAKKIVYVLDASASMGREGLWDRATQELTSSLSGLPDDAVFQIIVYNSRPRPLLSANPGWLSPTDKLLEQIAQAAATLPLEGTTNHGPALNVALAMRPEAVFFLTDADDLPFALLAQVDGWNRGRAVIHTFELNRREPARPGTPLQLLAQRHGGEYRSLTPPPLP